MRVWDRVGFSLVSIRETHEADERLRRDAIILDYLGGQPRGVEAITSRSAWVAGWPSLQRAPASPTPKSYQTIFPHIPIPMVNSGHSHSRWLKAHPRNSALSQIFTHFSHKFVYRIHRSHNPSLSAPVPSRDYKRILCMRLSRGTQASCPVPSACGIQIS